MVTTAVSLPPPLTSFFCRQRSIATAAFQCSSTNPENKSSDFNGGKAPTTSTPPLLKFAVTGVTELLRLFNNRPPNLREEFSEEKVVVRCVEDVVTVLRFDYGNAYFLTGKFTSDIYTEECLFEDPTIKFCGKTQYSKNLELIVPFLDCPSLELKEIEKGVNHDIEFILAKWKLRTYLKLPWRPLILIEGATTYNLNDNFEIFRHSESWEVSALDAVGQIFTPSRNK